MSKSNIFNRQSNGAKLPDTINITDSTSSLSTDTQATSLPSLVSTGSAVITKDLKVEDIAYINECRINTTPSTSLKPGQGFSNYITLSGEQMNDKNTLKIEGKLKLIGDLEANDITLKSNQVAKSFLAAPSNAEGLPLFRGIESADLPDTYVSSTGTQDPNKILAGPSSGSSKVAPTFRSLVATDLPDTYVSSTVTQDPNKILAGPSTGSSKVAPTFRSLVAADLPDTYVSSTVTQDPNKILAGPSTGSSKVAPEFRNIVPEDFGSITNISTKPVYLSISAGTTAKPAWSNVSVSSTDITTALGAVGVVAFGSVPNFPKQNRNLVFASANLQDEQRPSFRALTENDLPSTIVNTSINRPAKNVLVGPIPNNNNYPTSDAVPTWRPLELNDLPNAIKDIANTTTQGQNKVYAAPFNVPGNPSFRLLDMVDMPETVRKLNGEQMQNLLNTYPLNNHVYAGPLYDLFAFSTVTPNAQTKTFTVTQTGSTKIIKGLQANFSRVYFDKDIGGIPATTIYTIGVFTDTTFQLLQPDGSLFTPTNNTVVSDVHMTNESGSAIFRTLDINDMPSEVLTIRDKMNYLNNDPVLDNTVYAGRPATSITLSSVTPSTTTYAFTVSNSTLFGLQIGYSKVNFNKAIGGVTLGADYTIYDWTSTSFMLFDLNANALFIPTNNTAISNVLMTIVTTTPIFRSLVPADIPALNYAPTSGSTNYVSATTTRNANLIFAGPSTGTAVAPTFRNLTERDLPGFPNGQRYNSTTNGQFLGSVYYTTTSATFTNSITILANNVIQLVSNVTNTAAGVTPVVNGQLGGVVLAVNTGIQFSDAFASIATNTIYYIKSFTATIASSITTYTITVSDTMGGTTKTISVPSPNTAKTSTLTVVNFPTGFRNITSADLKTVTSGVTPISPPFDPANPDYVAPQEILAPSNVVILDQTQSANQICAAPNGVSGTPSFRALVATDIPDLSASYAPKNGSSNYVNTSAPSIVSNLTLPTTYNGAVNLTLPTSLQLGGIITGASTNISLTSNTVVTIAGFYITTGVWIITWRAAIYPTSGTASYASIRFVSSSNYQSITGTEKYQVQISNQVASYGTTTGFEVSLTGSDVMTVTSTQQAYYLNSLCNFTGNSNCKSNVTAVRIA